MSNMFSRRWMIFQTPYKERFAGRTKPWGTGQAILCCKDVVDAPFLVINADDYYGRAGIQRRV